MLKNRAAQVFLCFFISGDVRSEVQSALWTNEAMEKLESKGLALSDIFPAPNRQSIGLKKKFILPSRRASKKRSDFFTKI
jgi:hypothetical protein